MTKQRFDEHSTEFGLWLRNQKEIDSSLGFLATNIDYLWKNYKNKKWILIEEKRYMAEPKFWQEDIFKNLTEICNKDNNFYGFYLIQFEKTSPEDGKIFINKKQANREQLIKLLRFEL